MDKNQDPGLGSGINIPDPQHLKCEVILAITYILEVPVIVLRRALLLRS
jgi:hypothetical protein